MKQIEKTYEAKNFEDNIYQQWEKSGLFTPKIVTGKKPFTISMPPPNATGTLHLGHAIMLAVEDILVRYKRMQGFPTLWVPGTDHAGIATQNKVEKIIAEEGLTRHSLGREAFLKRVHEFVAGSQSTIRKQMRKMGTSCDWTRERYTLDDGLSKAVREIFTRMYNDGLIYRGKRIVNWCVRCSSTLADDEVNFKEEKSKFYYFKYGPVVIGTARPETKFLDKVIVAHPDDKRYKKYFDKEMTVPWIKGDIKAQFIADKSADQEFGTGAMTITPAHDFIDFEIAQKHKLEIVQIIDQNGNFTDVVGPEFAGKNARDSREAIVKILAEKGLLERVDENYVHNLSVCYRCGSPVEPLISEQWFIDVSKPVIKEGGKLISLKQKAAEAVKDGKIEIIPDRFNKIYFHWLNNLRDWCISRQIWFGHQIPVWYCQEKAESKCSQPIVQTEAPTKCPHCGSAKITRDPDTLDTWFSSGLWTFSTLGWPEKTKELEYFHPTSVLETGYDILFFWVARMVLMTTYALHEIPFEKVYLHGLVRDKEGRKMSKSLGNGIDPLDMIEKFGTDSVRLSLVIGTSPGNDFRLYEEKIAGYRNFVNKIWNGARFALMNLPENYEPKEFNKKSINSLADKWIVSKLQKLIKEVTEDLDNFRLSEAGTKIYDFTWSQYCDWYLEVSKGQMNADVLIYVLKTLLQLLHPFVPFVTEVLWEHLGEKKLLLGEDWPKLDKTLMFEKEEKEFEVVQSLITAIRSIRAEAGIEPVKKLNVIIYGGKYTNIIEQKQEALIRMARLEKLTLEQKGEKIEHAIWKYVDGVDLYIPMKDIFDIGKEKQKVQKKLQEADQKIKSLEAKLSNPGFLQKARPEIVAKEKEIFADLKNELDALEKKLKELEDLAKE
ncbi:MAG: valine--tRNA ligase [Candidatus Gracilibacteria bacterium]|jgi:valyl-tRNA synthetase